jgi:hypothetical protein
LQDKLSPIAKCFVLCSVLGRMGKINDFQKGKMKDLIIRENRFILAAAEAFEITQDLEDLLETILQILAL